VGRGVDIDHGYKVVVVTWSVVLCCLMFRYPVLYAYCYELMNLLDMQVRSSTFIMNKENNFFSFHFTVLECSGVFRALVDLLVSTHPVQIGGRIPRSQKRIRIAFSVAVKFELC